MNRIYTTFSLLLFFSISIFQKTSAADYYWVGGSGNWSDVANHWATTSGGNTFHANAPILIDNVFFDENSFTEEGQTVTLDIENAFCRNMSWFGVTNNPTFYSNNNTLNVYGSFTLNSNMTYEFIGGQSSTVFASTTSGNSITSAGIVVNSNFEFIAPGEFNLMDNLELGNDRRFLFNHGTLNTNNYNITTGSFVSNSSNNTIIINLGSSVITASIAGGWNLSVNPSLTFNAGTSIINLTSCPTSQNVFFTGGGKTYHNVNFIGDCFTSGNARILGDNTFNSVTFASNATIQGSNTFNNITFAGGSIVSLGNQTTNTVMGDFIVNSDCSKPTNIRSEGTSSTIHSPSFAINVSYISLQNIRATGVIPFNATNSTNIGGNVSWNITGPGSVDLYWVGGSGNWNDGSKWSLSSGGNPHNCVPSPLDNVFFDENSFSSTEQEVIINISTASCRNMVWSNVPNNTKFTNIGNNLTIYGSMSILPNMSVSFVNGNNPGLTFAANNQGNTINLAGKTFNCVISINGVGGAWTLEGDLNLSQRLLLVAGTLNTNGYDVRCTQFISDALTGSARALNMGSSTFTITATVSIAWNASTTSNLNINPGTSTINLTGCGFADLQFFGGGKNYHDVNFTGNCSAANFKAIVYGNNVFNKLSFNSNGSLTGNNTMFDINFSPGSTYSLSGLQIFVGEVNISGTSGWPVTVRSNSIGIPYTLRKNSGSVCVDYLIISDSRAEGGANWVAGSNSQDLGNNQGWTFGGTISTINITPAQPSICAGESITLSAEGADNLTWFPPEGLSATSGSSVTANPSTTTTYTVQSDGGECSSSQTITVSVSPLPSAAFSFTQSETNFSVDFSNESEEAVQFLWDFGNGNTSTEINPSFNFNAAGNYPVTLIVTNDCGSDTLLLNVVVIPVSIDVISLSNSLALYPNPFVEQFTLSLFLEKNANISYSIFDLLGNELYREYVGNINSFNKLIELNDKASGLYFLRLCADDFCVSKRMVKN